MLLKAFKKSSVKKAICLFISITFLFSDSATAMTLMPAAAINTAAFSFPDVLLNELSMHEKAEVDHVRHYTDQDIPFILHIQDAHANLDAQQNIKSILETINKVSEKEDADILIALEGAEGLIHPEYFDFFKNDDKANDLIVEDLLKKGELTGAELFAWEQYKKNKKSKIRFVGVEDAEVYLKNFQSYEQMVEMKDKALALIQKIYLHLSSATSKEFNSELLNFVKMRQKYKLGKHDISLKQKGDGIFSAYLDELFLRISKDLEIDLNSSFEQLRFPQLIRFLKLQEAIKALDEVQLKKNLEDFSEKFATLEKTKEENEWLEAWKALFVAKKWIEASSVSSQGKQGLNPRHLFEGMYRFMKKHSLDFELSSDLISAMKIIIFEYEMDAMSLFGEIEVVEDAIFSKLVQNDHERKYLEQLKQVELYEGLFNLELTRSQFEKYKTLEDEFFLKELLVPQEEAEFREYIKTAEDFYAFADQRDHFLFKNTVDMYKQYSFSFNENLMKPKNAVIVLISGGYHTDGLVKLFDRQKISHAVVRPKVFSLETDDKYEAVMKQKNADLSYYFGVKNPFGTYQQALLYRSVIESVIPYFVDEKKNSAEEIYQLLDESFQAHPLFSKKISIKQVTANQSPALEFKVLKSDKAIRSEALVKTLVSASANFHLQVDRSPVVEAAITDFRYPFLRIGSTTVESVATSRAELRQDMFEPADSLSHDLYEIFIQGHELNWLFVAGAVALAAAVLFGPQLIASSRWFIEQKLKGIENYYQDQPARLSAVFFGVSAERFENDIRYIQNISRRYESARLNILKLRREGKRIPADLEKDSELNRQAKSTLGAVVRLMNDRLEIDPQNKRLAREYGILSEVLDNDFLIRSIQSEIDSSYRIAVKNLGPRSELAKILATLQRAELRAPEASLPAEYVKYNNWPIEDVLRDLLHSLSNKTMMTLMIHEIISDPDYVKNFESTFFYQEVGRSLNQLDDLRKNLSGYSRAEALHKTVDYFRAIYETFLNPELETEFSQFKDHERIGDYTEMLLKARQQIIDFTGSWLGLIPAVPMETSLHSFLEGVARTVLEHRGEPVQINFDFPVDANRKIVTYPIVLQDVLENLLVNAYHATDPRKTGREREITLQTKYIAASDTHPEAIEISIQDNGTGMSDEVADRIFEKGFTTKAKLGSQSKRTELKIFDESDGEVEGTGIGTTSAKEKLETILEGGLRFETEEGVGTTFTLTLPLSVKPMTETQEQRARAELRSNAQDITPEQFAEKLLRYVSNLQAQRDTQDGLEQIQFLNRYQKDLFLVATELVGVLSRDPERAWKAREFLKDLRNYKLVNRLGIFLEERARGAVEDFEDLQDEMRENKQEDLYAVIEAIKGSNIFSPIQALPDEDLPVTLHLDGVKIENYFVNRGSLPKPLEGEVSVTDFWFAHDPHSIMGIVAAHRQEGLEPHAKGGIRFMTPLNRTGEYSLRDMYYKVYGDPTKLGGTQTGVIIDLADLVRSQDPKNILGTEFQGAKGEFTFYSGLTIEEAFKKFAGLFIDAGILAHEVPGPDIGMSGQLVQIGVDEAKRVFYKHLKRELEYLDLLVNQKAYTDKELRYFNLSAENLEKARTIFAEEFPSVKNPLIVYEKALKIIEANTSDVVFLSDRIMKLARTYVVRDYYKKKLSQEASFFNTIQELVDDFYDVVLPAAVKEKQVEFASPLRTTYDPSESKDFKKNANKILGAIITGGLGSQGAIDHVISAITAKGVVVAYRRTKDYLIKIGKIGEKKKLRVGINGAGDVGGSAASMIARGGDLIVMIQDVNGAVYRESGFTLEELQRFNTIPPTQRNVINFFTNLKGDSVQAFEGSDLGADVLFSGDKKYGIDVIVTAAIANTINEKNVDKIINPKGSIKAIVEGGNNTYKRVSSKLAESKIVVVTGATANIGGVMASSDENQIKHLQTVDEITRPTMHNIDSEGSFQGPGKMALLEGHTEEVVLIRKGPKGALKKGKIILRDGRVSKAHSSFPDLPQNTIVDIVRSDVDGKLKAYDRNYYVGSVDEAKLIQRILFQVGEGSQSITVEGGAVKEVNPSISEIKEGRAEVTFPIRERKRKTYKRVNDTIYSFQTLVLALMELGHKDRDAIHVQQAISKMLNDKKAQVYLDPNYKMRREAAVLALQQSGYLATPEEMLHIVSADIAREELVNVQYDEKGKVSWIETMNPFTNRKIRVSANFDITELEDSSPQNKELSLAQDGVLDISIGNYEQIIDELILYLKDNDFSHETLKQILPAYVDALFDSSTLISILSDSYQTFEQTIDNFFQRKTSEKPWSASERATIIKGMNQVLQQRSELRVDRSPQELMAGLTSGERELLHSSFRFQDTYKKLVKSLRFDQRTPVVRGNKSIHAEFLLFPDIFDETDFFVRFGRVGDDEGNWQSVKLDPKKLRWTEYENRTRYLLDFELPFTAAGEYGVTFFAEPKGAANQNLTVWQSSNPDDAAKIIIDDESSVRSLRWTSTLSGESFASSGEAKISFDIDPKSLDRVDFFGRVQKYDDPGFSYEVPLDKNQIREVNGGGYALTIPVDPREIGDYRVDLFARTKDGREILSSDLKRPAILSVYRSVEETQGLEKELQTYQSFIDFMKSNLERLSPQDLNQFLFDATKNQEGLRILVSKYFDILDKIMKREGLESLENQGLLPIYQILNTLGIGKDITFVTPEGAQAIGGGIGSVIRGLPDSLAEAGVPITIITNLYEENLKNKHRSAEEVLADGFEIHGKLVKPVEIGTVDIPYGPIYFAGTKNIQTPGYTITAKVYLAENNGVRYLLLRHPEMANRLYPDMSSSETLKRAIFLSRGALEIAKKKFEYGDGQVFDLQPSTMFSHDWVAGLMSYLNTVDDTYLADFKLQNMKVGHFIHNFAYQGRIFVNEDGYRDIWGLLNVADEHFFGLADPNDRNFLNPTAASVIYSTAGLWAPSAPYAREIVTAEGGQGLHYLLREKINHLSGISNGIELQSVRRTFWKTGIVAEQLIRYDEVENLSSLSASERVQRLQKHRAEILSATATEMKDELSRFDEIDEDEFVNALPRLKKLALKSAQIEYGLKEDDDAILFSFVGRVAEQKGLQLLAEQGGFGKSVLEEIVDKYPNAQFIFAGPPAPGDQEMQAFLELVKELEKKYPDRVRARLEMVPPSEALAIMFASHYFLMPSKYEPGGITQLEAMAGGTVVIGRKTGGIAATIFDYDFDQERGNGFLFQDFTGVAFQKAIENAVEALIAEPDLKEKLVLRALREKNNWSHRVPSYLSLFLNSTGALKYNYPHFRSVGRTFSQTKVMRYELRTETETRSLDDDSDETDFTLHIGGDSRTAMEAYLKTSVGLANEVSGVFEALLVEPEDRFVDDLTQYSHQVTSALENRGKVSPETLIEFLSSMDGLDPEEQELESFFKFYQRFHQSVNKLFDQPLREVHAKHPNWYGHMNSWEMIASFLVRELGLTQEEAEEFTIRDFYYRFVGFEPGVQKIYPRRSNSLAEKVAVNLRDGLNKTFYVDYKIQGMSSLLHLDFYEHPADFLKNAFNEIRRSELRTEEVELKEPPYGEFAINLYRGNLPTEDSETGVVPERLSLDVQQHRITVGPNDHLDFFFNVRTESPVEDATRRILARAYIRNDSSGAFNPGETLELVDDFQNGDYRFGYEVPDDFSGEITFQYSVDGGQTWRWANKGREENYIINRINTKFIFERSEEKFQRVKEILKTRERISELEEGRFDILFSILKRAFNPEHVVASSVSAERLALEMEHAFVNFLDFTRDSHSSSVITAFNPQKVNLSEVVVATQSRIGVTNLIRSVIQEKGYVVAYDEKAARIMDVATGQKVTVYFYEIHNSINEPLDTQKELPELIEAIDRSLAAHYKKFEQELRVKVSSKTRDIIRQGKIGVVRHLSGNLESIVSDIFATHSGEPLTEKERTEAIDEDLKKLEQAIENLESALRLGPELMPINGIQMSEALSSKMMTFIQDLKDEAYAIAMRAVTPVKKDEGQRLRVSEGLHRQSALNIFLNLTEEYVRNALEEKTHQPEQLTAKEMEYMQEFIVHTLRRNFALIQEKDPRAEKERKINDELLNFQSGVKIAQGDVVLSEDIAARLEGIKNYVDAYIDQVERNIKGHINYAENEEVGEVIQMPITALRAIETVVIPQLNQLRKVGGAVNIAIALDVESFFKQVILAMRGQESGDLIGAGATSEVDAKEEVILFARELNPWKMMQLIQNFKIKAIVTDGASIATHWVLVAENSKIPVLTIDEANALFDISDPAWFQEEVIIDGVNGEMILRANVQTYDQYVPKLREQETLDRLAKRIDPSKLPIKLAANADTPTEVKSAIEGDGVEDIGLVRTEYQFGKENQKLRHFLEIYRKLAVEAGLSDESAGVVLFRFSKVLANSDEFKQARLELLNFFRKDFYAKMGAIAGVGTVTFRTLDMQRDKEDSDPKFMQLINPLRKFGPDFYKTPIGEHLLKIQIEALLKANAEVSRGQIRILFPMFTHPDDLLKYAGISEGKGWDEFDPVADQEKLNKKALADIRSMRDLFSSVQAEVSNDEAFREEVLKLDAFRVSRGLKSQEEALHERSYEGRIKGAKVGLMLETIEALEVLPEILKRFDFVSVGSNDLTVSLFREFGIDRESEASRDFFNKLKVRLIKAIRERILKVVSEYNASITEDKKPISVTICGAAACTDTFALVMAHQAPANIEFKLSGSSLYASAIQAMLVSLEEEDTQFMKHVLTAEQAEKDVDAFLQASVATALKQIRERRLATEEFTAEYRRVRAGLADVHEEKPRVLGEDIDALRLEMSRNLEAVEAARAGIEQEARGDIVTVRKPYILGSRGFHTLPASYMTKMKSQKLGVESINFFPLGAESDFPGVDLANMLSVGNSDAGVFQMGYLEISGAEAVVEKVLSEIEETQPLIESDLGDRAFEHRFSVGDFKKGESFVESLDYMMMNPNLKVFVKPGKENVFIPVDFDHLTQLMDVTSENIKIVVVGEGHDKMMITIGKLFEATSDIVSSETMRNELRRLEGLSSTLAFADELLADPIELFVVGDSVASLQGSLTFTNSYADSIYNASYVEFLLPDTGIDVMQGGEFVTMSATEFAQLWIRYQVVSHLRQNQARVENPALDDLRRILENEKTKEGVRTIDQGGTIHLQLKALPDSLEMFLPVLASLVDLNASLNLNLEGVSDKEALEYQKSILALGRKEGISLKENQFRVIASNEHVFESVPTSELKKGDKHGLVARMEVFKNYRRKPGIHLFELEATALKDENVFSASLITVITAIALDRNLEEYLEVLSPRAMNPELFSSISESVATFFAATRKLAASA